MCQTVRLVVMNHVHVPTKNFITHTTPEMIDVVKTRLALDKSAVNVFTTNFADPLASSGETPSAENSITQQHVLTLTQSSRTALTAQTVHVYCQLNFGNRHFFLAAVKKQSTHWTLFDVFRSSNTSNTEQFVFEHCTHVTLDPLPTFCAVCAKFVEV